MTKALRLTARPRRWARFPRHPCGACDRATSGTGYAYELNNRIRLINVAEFSVSTAEGFIGFICGIISQDHDLEAMYLDSFLKLAGLEGEDITATLAELDQISTKYHVNFVLSVSMDGEELPESAKDMLLVAL